ncbi:MAG: DUF1080 domain-containing protein [Actinobacteria bacterium]|nr:DUF1080 domain-containing protein [Actinomycetota bacterium]
MLISRKILLFCFVIIGSITLIITGGSTLWAGSFANPDADVFDPYIVTYNGYYYLVGTSYNTGIYIQKSSTIAGLRSATRTLIYSFSPSGPGPDFAESPTIYYLQEKWYLYFGARDSDTGKYGNYVLEGTTDDPIGPYNYKALIRSADVAYTILGPSVLQKPNGSLYLCATTFGLFIQPMSNPWTVTGSNVTIRDGYDDKTYSWEGGTWEVSSPFIHTVDEETTYTIPYSSENHVIKGSDGPDGWSWSVGAMVNTDGDILNPDSWSKKSTPLMHGGPDCGLYRVLAVSHFKSLDGNEDWIVYNAGDNLIDNFDVRRTFVQKFTWDEDGTPNFGTPYNLISTYTTPSGETGSPTAYTPGSTMFSDSFSSSANWTVVSGTWSVSDNKYYAEGESENVSKAGQTYWDNYYVQATAVATSAANNGGLAVLGRVMDNSNFYQLAFYTDGSGVRKWRIDRNVDGNYTTLKSGTLYWDTNTQYTLRLVLNEYMLTGLYSIDGTNFQVLGTVDTDVDPFSNDDSFDRRSYGKIGLRMWGGTVGYYKDVIVKKERPSWGRFYGGPGTTGFAIACGSTSNEEDFVFGRDAEGYDPLCIGGALASTNNSVDTSDVINPAPENVYKKQRYSSTRMYYDFPNLETNTNYLIRLHFNEYYYNSTGQRSFHVELNGTRVLTNYDVLADAGSANKAVCKEYVVKSDQFGHIQVAFLHGSVGDGNPIINGIEVRPITTIFSDNFNSGTLTGWTSISGTWTNPGTVAQGVTGAVSDGFLMKNTSTATNLSYESDIKINTSNAAGALIFRSNSNATNAYAVNIDSSGQFIKLFKFPYTQLATHDVTLSTGVWYHLKVTMIGNTIRVYFNNKAKPVITYTDSTYSSGRFGINSWNGTVQFDNVIAYYGSQVYADDFNSGTLTGWTSVSGTWTNPGTVAQGATGAGSDGFLMHNTACGADFTYESDIKINTSNAAGALIFRSNSNATNTYAVNIDSSGQFIKLFKFPYVQLATSDQTISTGVWYHLKVTMIGNTIKVYFNNSLTPAITYTDSTYSAGRFGINSWNGTVQIDNVVVYYGQF